MPALKEAEFIVASRPGFSLGDIGAALPAAIRPAKAVLKARERSTPVEQVLMSDFSIRPAQIGPSLAKFFGVPYEPFHSGRIRVESLQGPLKRDFALEQGWIPLEESPEGLVVMCIDPEAVRGSRIVPQVFPRHSKYAYRVTTQTEFEETLAQIYGADEGGTIDELLADLSAPMDDEGEDGDAVSAAADNELVKFVNKVIIDAYNQGASDIHIEPYPGKAKTEIRFRKDGSLGPYIEVPAHFRQALVTRLKIPATLGDYFNTRLSSISPYDKYDAQGSVTDLMRAGTMRIEQVSFAIALDRS